MAGDDFERRMRDGECFHSLRVAPGAFIVVRVDGRSFSRFTERVAEKPFDARFHSWMVHAARALLVGLQAAYVYTESDEISVLLPRAFDLFDREVEKLVSLCASRASGVFSIACGEPVEFDARLWVGARAQDVVDYFRWRQADATRCALNGWCYWTLRASGADVREATRALEGASVGEKNELLFARGVNFNAVPAWQRRGTGVYWADVEKQGFNPKTQQAVVVTRRSVVVDEELPMKAEYDDFIRGRMGER